jgi:ribonucleotide reductase alpha subunit
LSNIPFSTVGYITYKRTYARNIEGENRTEEFEETIDRVLKASQEQLKVGFTDAEVEQLREYMLGLKVSVAGRFLWQLGTKTVRKYGLPSLQNCAATVIDEPIRPFTWAMDLLMLGSGVGYNIQREHVNKLPPVSKKFSKPIRQDDPSADYIVPDTREGWVGLLGKVLKAAFYADRKHSFTYSTQLIRGYGVPIKGFGGTASGPEILVQGIDQIATVIEARRGQQLRPVDCLDIMNIIGSIVVAGNVRRSAQIAIGDADDIDYLNAKRWDLGNIPNWRAMSNNSIAWNGVDELPEEFWAGYEGKGEPYGLINLELSRQIGRLGETEYPDPDVIAYNPCAEQSLNKYETCCLAELFLPNITSKAELINATKLIYRVAKHSLSLPAKGLEETAAIVNKNMRMGIGVTGYLQATEEQRSWLSDCYTELRKFDKEYSAANDFPISIKLTTVKPSGTLSLLPGVTAGAHPAYAQYMIRRIRIAATHPLVQVCRDHGYKVEEQLKFDGTVDHTTVVVEFPFSHPDGTVIAKDLTAIELLGVVKRLQTEWSDNSVSCTVYYRKEELPTIKEYLKNNFKDNHKSLSFLLHSEHGFLQAPLEEITKEHFDSLVANTKLITRIEQALNLDLDSDCAGGACPVR